MSNQTSTTKTGHPKRGDVVEVIRDTTGSDYSSPRLCKGMRFVVDEYLAGFTPDDPEYGDDNYHQGAAVFGDLNGCSVEVDAALVKVATVAADVKQPATADVLGKLTVDDSDGDWFVHESGPEDDNTRYFTFTDRTTGADWVAYVRVVGLHQAD